MFQPKGIFFWFESSKYLGSYFSDSLLPPDFSIRWGHSSLAKKYWQENLGIAIKCKISENKETHANSNTFGHRFIIIKSFVATKRNLFLVWEFWMLESVPPQLTSTNDFSISLGHSSLSKQVLNIKVTK